MTRSALAIAATLALAVTLPAVSANAQGAAVRARAISAELKVRSLIMVIPLR